MAASHPQEISAGASRPTSPRHLAHKKHPRVSTTVGPARGPACQRRLVGHIASPKLVPWQRHKDKATIGPPPYFFGKGIGRSFSRHGKASSPAQPSPGAMPMAMGICRAVPCLCARCTAGTHRARPHHGEADRSSSEKLGSNLTYEQ
jgi:hypothetical protein